MIFHDCWLTAPALPQSKRDLGKLGIAMLDQLETLAVPPGRIRCKVRVALRKDDAGEQFNRVRCFDVIAIDELQADPFAPAEPQLSASAAAPAPDVTFDFGANVGGAS
jgi:hypothetical protein